MNLVNFDCILFRNYYICAPSPVLASIIVVATVLVGLSGCTSNDDSKFSADESYDIDSDPWVQQINELESTPEGAAEFRRKIAGVLAKPALATIMAYRQNPVGAAIFSDSFIAKHRTFLQSISFAELFNVQGKKISFSNRGKEEFSKLAARFAAANQSRPSLANLQLLDEDDPASNCQAIYKEWEKENGKSAWHSLFASNSECNFLCKLGASASLGAPSGYTMGGPTAGGAFKATLVNPKYLAMLKMNHCGKEDSNCFSTASGQLGGVTTGDCKGDVAQHKNKRICERYGIYGSPWHSVNGKDQSLYCRCENNNCAPGI